MAQQVIGDDAAGLYVDTDLSAPWFASDASGLYADLDSVPPSAAGADDEGLWLAEWFVSVQEWIDAAWFVRAEPKLEMVGVVFPKGEFSAQVVPKMTLDVTILGGGGDPGG